jgi:hypothetical protein
MPHTRALPPPPSQPGRKLPRHGLALALAPPVACLALVWEAAGLPLSWSSARTRRVAVCCPRATAGLPGPGKVSTSLIFLSSNQLT